MIQFQIDWNIYSQRICSERKGFLRPISIFQLDEEWHAVSVWYNRSNLFPEVIEIRRETTTGEYEVSGRLTLLENGKLAIEQEFSQIVTFGSSLTEINLPVSEAAFEAGSPKLVIVRGCINITLCCDECSNVPANGESQKAKNVMPLVELSNDFERLMNPNTSCWADVTLKCGSISMSAHKHILSAYSPVFAAMFSNTTKENLENEVVFTDLGESVLKAMVKHIYTGKIVDLSVLSATDLLFAADKYQMRDLKKVCCDFLKHHVTDQNVLKILELGELLSEELKSFAVDYIIKMYPEFSILENTREWTTLLKERPSLAEWTSSVKPKDEKLKH